MSKVSVYEDKFISPAWLYNHRSDENLLIFETGDNEQANYLEAHLPGAVYLDTNIYERAPNWNILPPGEL